MQNRILIIGGLPQSLINFRGSLLREMIVTGNSVFACAGGHDPITEEKLRQLGVDYFPVKLSRAGMNPLEDVRTLVDLVRLIRLIKPDIVLSYTIKPVIYGSLAANFCRVPYIFSMITGLGFAFMETASLRRQVISFFAHILYRTSLKKNRKVFFQNPDDRQLFIERKIVFPEQAVLLNGSGVDIDHFSVVSLPNNNILSFLLIARLLHDKGISEYVAAARIIKAKYPKTIFRLVGPIDPNPSAISMDELKEWVYDGGIEYLGELEDVRPAIAESSVYVLPSYYREGTPRTVLEAMAMGRPIITTDAPGCRETIKRIANNNKSYNKNRVIQGENGFLVPIKNVQTLAYAMEQFIRNPKLVEQMGRLSREYAVEKYDVNKVNAFIEVLNWWMYTEIRPE